MTRYAGEVVAAVLGLLAAYLVVIKPALLVLVAGALGLMLAAVYRPRLTLYGLAMLLLLEGALRKWLLPGLQEWIYLAKDGLTLALAAAVLTGAADTQPQETPAITAPISRATVTAIAALAAYLALSLVNPRNPSLLLYVFGVRSYLLPLALLAVVPAVATAPAALKLWRALLWAAIPLMLLAAAQTLLPPGHVLNRYVGWTEMNVVAVTGRGPEATVRATGTFSFISGFTAYLVVIAATAPAVLIGLERRRLAWGLAALAAVFVALVLTGSRGPLVQAALTLAAATIPLWRLQQRNGTAPQHRWPGLAARALVLLAVAGVLLQRPMTQFAQRVQTVDDVDVRIARIFAEFVEGARSGGAFGWGPGTMHQSRETLTRLTGGGKLPRFVEEETGRIITELGLIGAPLWYMLLWTVVVDAVRRFRQAHEDKDRRAQCAAVATALLTAQAAVGGMVYNVYLYYFWALWLGVERCLAARTQNADTAQADAPNAAATA